ncbi:MAG: sulfurtransferase [Gammaproteobacteria bacterium]|nr:sulfurtransferase [Gammaproteobacteria bacterium]
MLLRALVYLLLCVSCTGLATESWARGALITSQALSEQLHNPDLVLIDMSEQPQYQRFHLPGALALPYDALVVQQNGTSQPLPQPQLIRLLGKLGIRSNANVIIYDDIGGLNAARLYWELEQLGHPRCALLDGGLVQWILENRPVTNLLPAALPPTVYNAAKTGRSAQSELQDIVTATATHAIVLDVRSAQEYRGDPTTPRSGHVPGARWWEWDHAVNYPEGFVQRDETQLTASLAAVGIKDKQQPIITYCRSSHRASQTYFTLKRLGFENVKLYTGSMLEYEQQKNLPLTTGMNP